MTIRCERCGAQHDVDERRIPVGGTQFQCPACKHRFAVQIALEDPSLDLPVPKSFAADMDLPAPKRAGAMKMQGGSGPPSIALSEEAPELPVPRRPTPSPRSATPSPKLPPPLPLADDLALSGLELSEASPSVTSPDDMLDLLEETPVPVENLSAVDLGFDTPGTFDFSTGEGRLPSKKELDQVAPGVPGQEPLVPKPADLPKRQLVGGAARREIAKPRSKWKRVAVIAGSVMGSVAVLGASGVLWQRAMHKAAISAKVASARSLMQPDTLSGYDQAGSTLREAAEDTKDPALVGLAAQAYYSAALMGKMIDARLGNDLLASVDDGALAPDVKKRAV